MHNIMRKCFLTAALCLSLAGPAFAGPAGGQAPGAGPSEVAISLQAAAANDAAQSEVADNVDKSQVAKKMTQAEKSQNAQANDPWGGAITIIAMIIVVSALAILSILFLCFGKVSAALITRQKRRASKNMTRSGASPTGKTEIDSGEVIAAISMALSEHFGDSHDMEDTILTIRRMKRAYSPWNSKIYNLRQIPDLHRQAPRRSAFEHC